MKISRRTALKTCSAASASAVMATAAADDNTNTSSGGDQELLTCLKSAVIQTQQLQDASRQTAKINARWNLLATQAGNCQRIASVILNHLQAGRPASPANVQACADSCGELILTTHVLSASDANEAITSLSTCKQACLKWLSLNLA